MDPSILVTTHSLPKQTFEERQQQLFPFFKNPNISKEQSKHQILAGDSVAVQISAVKNANLGIFSHFSISHEYSFGCRSSAEH